MKALPEETAEALAQEIETGMVDGRPGGAGTVGERVFQFEAGMLTFGVEAAPVTPEKPHNDGKGRSVARGTGAAQGDIGFGQVGSPTARTAYALRR